MRTGRRSSVVEIREEDVMRTNTQEPGPYCQSRWEEKYIKPGHPRFGPKINNVDTKRRKKEEQRVHERHGRARKVFIEPNTKGIEDLVRGLDGEPVDGEG